MNFSMSTLLQRTGQDLEQIKDGRLATFEVVVFLLIALNRVVRSLENVISYDSHSGLPYCPDSVLNFCLLAR